MEDFSKAAEHHARLLKALCIAEIARNLQDEPLSVDRVMELLGDDGEEYFTELRNMRSSIIPGRTGELTLAEMALIGFFHTLTSLVTTDLMLNEITDSSDVSLGAMFTLAMRAGSGALQKDVGKRINELFG
jgi:hypothetical protein